MDHAFKIAPGKKVRLADYDPNANGDMKKEEGLIKLGKLTAELGTLQEELYAASQHSVLMILQGIDTSGKDGTIRSVLIDVNPQGCQVEAFKVPTEEELAHDFLWRAHRVTPRQGIIGVFNRSHYEDVLVVRVHTLVPEKSGKHATTRSTPSNICWRTTIRSSSSSTCISARKSRSSGCWSASRM